MPIYDVHVKIREKLAATVSGSSADWPIGSCFLKHVRHVQFSQCVIFVLFV